jgi:hypothetical protein
MSKFQKQVEEMREGLDIFRNNKKYPFFVKEGPGGLWFTVKYTGIAPPPGNRESWFSYMADILDYNSGYSVNYVSDRELKLKHSQEIWDRTSKRWDLKWRRIWHQNPHREDFRRNPISIEEADKQISAALRAYHRAVDAAGAKAIAGKISWDEVDRVRKKENLRFMAARKAAAIAAGRPDLHVDEPARRRTRT